MTWDDFRKLEKEAYIFILWWAQGKESLRIRNLKRRIHSSVQKANGENWYALKVADEQHCKFGC